MAKVLIVDDEQVHVRLLDWAFRKAGFENLCSVTDSTKAINEFGRFKPDLVLLDLYMPQVDGFMVLGQIRRELAPNDFLPVLVLTGEDTSDTRSRAMSAGAHDFLTKPLNYSEVMLRAKNLLQTRLLYQQTRRLKAQIDQLTGK